MDWVVLCGCRNGVGVVYADRIEKCLIEFKYVDVNISCGCDRCFRLCCVNFVYGRLEVFYECCGVGVWSSVCVDDGVDGAFHLFACVDLYYDCCCLECLCPSWL